MQQKVALMLRMVDRRNNIFKLKLILIFFYYGGVIIVKNPKLLSKLFLISALFLSHLMCIVVSSQFTYMYYFNSQGITSAPASIALLNICPFILAIAISLIFHFHFKEK